MKVILTEKVPSLGNVGEMHNVSEGYGRNYLLRRKLAVLANESNKAQLENNKRRLNKKIEAERAQANAVKSKLDGMTLELIKKVGNNGKLFGTVTNADLAKELSSKGIEVERRLIHIENPIKNLGTFDVKAKLFSDVEAKFSVKVSMSAEQAKEMKEKQAAAEKKAKERKKAPKEENAEENTDATPENTTEEA